MAFVNYNCECKDRLIKHFQNKIDDKEYKVCNVKTRQEDLVLNLISYARKEDGSLLAEPQWLNFKYCPLCGTKLITKQGV